MEVDDCGSLRLDDTLYRRSGNRRNRAQLRRDARMALACAGCLSMRPTRASWRWWLPKPPRTCSSMPAAATCSCVRWKTADAAGIEMLALDKGPGIAERGPQSSRMATPLPELRVPGWARSRGFPTSYDIYTQRGPGNGADGAGMEAQRRAAALPRDFASAASASDSRRGCRGDGWVFQEGTRGGRITHGRRPGPRRARRRRRRGRHAHRPRTCRAITPPALLERIHGALRAYPRRGGRGGGDRPPGGGWCVSPGSAISAAPWCPPSGPVRRMVSHDGTAGHQIAEDPGVHLSMGFRLSPADALRRAAIALVLRCLPGSDAAPPQRDRRRALPGLRAWHETTSTVVVVREDEASKA